MAELIIIVCVIGPELMYYIKLKCSNFFDVRDCDRRHHVLFFG